MEFENEEDRDFYVNKDEAHIAFKKTLKGLVGDDDALVMDYFPGEY